jgi:hypothetical protein
LASRLARNRFASGDLADLTGPVLPLNCLTPEDCYVLLWNVRHVHASGDKDKYVVPDDAIEAYLRSCQQRMGAAYFQTPRETVKDFIGLLNVVEQNRQVDWRTLIAGIKTVATPPQDPSIDEGRAGKDDDLASFKV